VPAQDRINGAGRIVVNHDLVAVHDFHDRIECRRPFAFAYGLLGPAQSRLLVAQGDGLNAADQVRQRRVRNEVFEAVSMGGRDELHAALCDGPRGRGLVFSADLVDDDHLGHVVFDRLDHHGVLAIGVWHLHSAGGADRRVRYIAIAGDLVGGIDHDDALCEIVRKDAGRFAQTRCLPDARRAEEQNTHAALEQVAYGFNGAEHCAPDAQRKSHHAPLPIANGRHAVQRAGNAGAVVGVELTDSRNDEIEILVGH
jgi:hypothetical protein